MKSLLLFALVLTSLLFTHTDGVAQFNNCPPNNYPDQPGCNWIPNTTRITLPVLQNLGGGFQMCEFEVSFCSRCCPITQQIQWAYTGLQMIDTNCNSLENAAIGWEVNPQLQAILGKEVSEKVLELHAGQNCIANNSIAPCPNYTNTTFVTQLNLPCYRWIYTGGGSQLKYSPDKAKGMSLQTTEYTNYKMVPCEYLDNQIYVSCPTQYEVCYEIDANGKIKYNVRKSSNQQPRTIICGNPDRKFQTECFGVCDQL